ncbi:PREDICTED: BTB/POZ domain-containing protein DOT3 [Nicotiana attenuata]|uniref:Btbpoz domain-containing protein dot3 n=1 Tax=Nicotiana attenuata TaxID=49451 RepID=A0A1J6IMV7_NICAT|nr:PREDICTED: BTB/POZ domain-containing protein DOT3 [Nicotiana attenuata]OIT05604.1 btbpoz domain-containing protein dot3 [Nicotiana attenuata]
MKMQKLIQLDQLENTGDETDDTRQLHDQRIVVPTILNQIADGFEKKEQSWFATSQLPSDLSIRVDDITFYVHKYPLVARCAYLREIEFQPQNSHLGYDLKLEKFPGGSENFEIILKFCYGLPISLNPGNVAALRCGSEFLEMTEAMEEGNLISKTEAFFTFVVLSSWNDSITVLKSCETLSPWAENLQIVRRCCDSIGWKIFRKNSTEEITNEETWWFDDVATLCINFFLRIITAIRVKGIKPEIMGSCIMHYGEKWLPNMNSETKGTDKYGSRRNDSQWSITSGRMQETSIGQNNKEQRTIIESLISILPPQKEAVSCKFLLRLLKMAMLYAASPALISELEKRIGMVLENASPDDLLIPTYAVSEQTINSTEEQTIHNIDVVQRILDYFLLYEQQILQQQETKSTTVNISKLVDSYLAEIARDHNVSITKFQVLAESLPRHVRTCHDGLYRAIDTYLKTHPLLSEHDRRRLCKIMDSEKLSLDACMHAAQNERLPLRIVIQVLLSEQVKMRAAVQGKDTIASDDNNSDKESNWLSTKKEVKYLKEELDKVKIQMTDLQRDYSELQQEYEKVNNKPRTSWTSGWRKMKKSALFNRKMVEEETQEGENRVKPGRRASIN